ncbi:hypothetical protein MBLNU230_g7990t1 [Neophaeotheca triangularis]
MNPDPQAMSLEQTRAALRELVRQNRHCQMANDSYFQQNNALQAELNRARARIQELTEQLAQRLPAEQTTRTSPPQATSPTGREATASAQLERLQTKNAELTHQAVSFREDLDRSWATAAKQQKELTQLRNERATLAERIEKHQKETAQLKNERAALKDLVKEFEANLAKAQNAEKAARLECGLGTNSLEGSSQLKKPLTLAESARQLLELANGDEVPALEAFQAELDRARATPSGDSTRSTQSKHEPARCSIQHQGAFQSRRDNKGPGTENVTFRPKGTAVKVEKRSIDLTESDGEQSAKKTKRPHRQDNAVEERSVKGEKTGQRMQNHSKSFHAAAVTAPPDGNTLRAEDSPKAYRAPTNTGLTPSCNPDHFEAFSHLLRSLALEKCALDFLKPVNQEADEADDPPYYDVVANPRSLLDITNKLEREGYGSLCEVDWDIRLIAENAKWYNPSNHPVCRYAEVFKETYQKLLDKHFRELRTAIGYEKLRGSRMRGRR